MVRLPFFPLLFCLFFISFVSLGQGGSRPASISSDYFPQEIFAPGFYSNKAQPFHSSNGAPASNYWQNKADYTIQVSLDTVKNELTGSVTIHYTNNSPDTLHSLWLQLDQNTYRRDARSNNYTGLAGTDFTNGYELESVRLSRNAPGDVAADYIVTDTRLQIRLTKPLAPGGGKINIIIRYHYIIPGAFGNRTDYFATRNGKVYEIAQFYPRMCVYDDREGWNTLPFLGSGEFYCEYGDFDYKVTVPRDMIVAGSGELQNPKEVLTEKEITRMDAARASDKTVMIRTAAEVAEGSGHRGGAGAGSAAKAGAGTAKAGGAAKAGADGAGAGVAAKSVEGMLTWHFAMKNTRDVAFGTSRAYIWDAARVNLPGGKKCVAMSVYPVESAGDNAWGRATEYLKVSIEHFSEKWFVYPYPVAVNEAGIAGGMEYPGIVFDGINDKGKELYWVTAHEIGHNWFPMIVGSDERRYGWMDEGFNTFIDIYASDAFNKGEFAPKRDDEYAPKGGNPADEITKLLDDADAPIMMTLADAIPEKYRHPIVYFKPAFGLVLLREAILGKDRFDYAFKRYIKNWAFKHPSPVDFFHTMDNESGEDLAWFWREWYYHNWSLDLAVEAVTYVQNDPKKGILITLNNLDRMAMPSVMELEWQDGTKTRVAVPVETWLQSGTRQLRVAGGQSLRSVTLDPDHILPDADRRNNLWKNGGY
jgi:hypothetical protein